METEDQLRQERKNQKILKQGGIIPKQHRVSAAYSTNGDKQL